MMTDESPPVETIKPSQSVEKKEKFPIEKHYNDTHRLERTTLNLNHTYVDLLVKRKVRKKYDVRSALTEDLFTFIHNPLIIKPSETLKELPEGYYFFGLDTGKPPLMLSDAELQALVDSAYTQDDMFQQFQELIAYIENYHADRGKLHELIRMYTAQNAYIYNTDDEYAVLKGLHNAISYERFLSYIKDYVHRCPGTRTSTETLFLLEGIASSNLGDLVALLDSENVLKSPLLRKVYTKYREKIDRFLFYNAGVEESVATEEIIDRVIEKYDSGCVDYMDLVIRYSPGNYRKGDARFIQGRIHAQRERWNEALVIWKRGKPDTTDIYYDIYSEILGIINSENDLDTQIWMINHLLTVNKIHEDGSVINRAVKLGYDAIILK